MDAEMILHPVRMRIITAVSGRQVTTRQLLKTIPEIPQATLYRHIRALISGGVLEVVEERQIRGVEERVLRMKGPPSISKEDLKGRTRADLERMAFVFVSGLLSDMRRYLRGRKGTVDPFRDGVQISKVQIYLSDTETEELNREIQRIILAALKNQPSGNRKGRIISYTIIPST